jgi:hypothetical protein
MTTFPTKPIILIRMPDIRRVKMCSNGTREFFTKHNLDWNSFLINGITSDKLEATGDALAINVVKAAR